MVCRARVPKREREREERESERMHVQEFEKGKPRKIGKQAQQAICENQKQNQRTILEPWPPNMQFTGWALRQGDTCTSQSQSGGAPPKPGHGDPGIGEACLASCPGESPRCTVNARDQTGTYDSGEHHPGGQGGMIHLGQRTRTPANGPRGHLGGLGGPTEVEGGRGHLISYRIISYHIAIMPRG